MNYHSIVAALSLVWIGAVSAAEPVSFRKDIVPILVDNCLACHGPKKAEGDYRVDSFERVGKHGESELDPLKAKELDDSELYRRIVSDDVDERMPLDTAPLKREQIEIVKRWISEGAKYDGDDPSEDLYSIMLPPEYPPAPSVYPNTMPLTAMVFTTDGSELIVGGYHELSVWNPEDGTLIRRLANLGERIFALSISPDGKKVAVGSGAPGRLGEARIIDLHSGALDKSFGMTHDVVMDVAFSPDGKRLAVAAADNTLEVFSVESGAEVLKITSHSNWVTAISWSSDGKQIAAASRDKTAKVFDGETGELLITYAGHNKPVRGVMFHPDGKQIFSSGADNKIHRWNTADAKKTAEIGFGGPVYKLTNHGDTFVATSADKTVRQFEAQSHKLIRQYTGQQDWVLSAAFHKETKRVASGAFDGQVIIWNSENGEQVTKFTAAPGYSPK